MRIKFYHRAGCWHSGYLKNEGGISSLFIARSGTFKFCLFGLFKNFRKALKLNKLK